MGDLYLVKAHQEVLGHCTWTNESSPRPMFYRLDGYKLCHIWLLKLLVVLQSVAWGLMPLWTSWVCVCAPWAWGMEWVGLALGPGTMWPSWIPGRPEDLSTGIFTMISSIPSSLLSSVRACSITQHWSKFTQCQLGFAALERGCIQSSYLCYFFSGDLWCLSELHLQSLKHQICVGTETMQFTRPKVAGGL